MKTRDMIMVAVSLFIFSGCASSPKTAATISTPKIVRWEYRTLKGFDVAHGPEAKKLEQDGWTYVGTGGAGGNMAEDYGMVSAQAAPEAFFRRPYQ